MSLTLLVTTDSSLTLSPPISLRLYTLPYWSNRSLIFAIRALWRSRLSARAPECQKFKMVLYPSKSSNLERPTLKGLNNRLFVVFVCGSPLHYDRLSKDSIILFTDKILSKPYTKRLMRENCTTSYRTSQDCRSCRQ